MEVLEQILKGAQDKASEAGIPILGGHTIEDPEPKYGMVVSGIVHPDKIIKNKGAQPGDILILTKPIGTGILSTAIKRGMVSEEKRKEVTDLMAQLNKVAGETILSYNVHACTDVTGFGLLGHLSEMSMASECDVTVFYDKIPFMEDVKNLATAGVIPGGTYNNLDFVATRVDFGNLPRTDRLLLCDAQTSGGLLISIPEKQAYKLLQELTDKGLSPALIGEFTKTGKGIISIK
jgi:selenide,water dikinase